MSDAETLASWIDQLSNAEAYAEATEFRRVFVASIKADGVGFDGVTPARIVDVLQHWHAGSIRNWPGLDVITADQAAQCSPLVVEWLLMFNDGKIKPALLTADDYVGVLHAMRCALRGKPLELPEQGAAAPAMRGSFNLKPKV